MSRANKSAARVTLSSNYLDGYTGRVDIVSYGRKPKWWERLLRRDTGPRVISAGAYVVGKGDKARVWRRGEG